MGGFTSRQNNAAVEEAEQSSTHAYKYPPRSGNFFGSHFIMGGERFDTPQPESYLFGENVDLNFLGNRPTAFPYPPPQANEPTKTLKSLVNIRKESVRFVKTTNEKKLSAHEELDGNVLCIPGGGGDSVTSQSLYNIEFIFDSDARCSITVYYFCTEEFSPSGVTLTPRDGYASETYHYEKGLNQVFSQSGHVFNPHLIPEDDFAYNPQKEQLPVAIHCVVEEGNEECRQSHTTICVIDHHPESSTYVLRALKQKIFVDGLSYLLQEIYGIENKAANKGCSIDEEIDDHGSECVICMSETRDTLILPCRHLCLCNSCADSLRYQANNCPICRAPFRALLQIRAVQKGVPTHGHVTSGAGDQHQCGDQHIPPGYIPVSLIEALNGPPQYVGRTRRSDGDITDGITNVGPIQSDSHKTTSPPQKPNSQRRSKTKRTVSTNTNINANNENTIAPAGVMQANDNKDKSLPKDKLQIVNERQSLKAPKVKRSTMLNKQNNQIPGVCNNNDDDDDDSENEKLSPLLSPGSRCVSEAIKSKNINKDIPKQEQYDAKVLDNHNSSIDNNNEIDDDGADAHQRDNDNDIEIKECELTCDQSSVNCISIDNTNKNVTDGNIVIRNTSPLTVKKSQLKKNELSAGNNVTSSAMNRNTVTITEEGNNLLNAEDSDYYTPEDTNNSILSPLCPERQLVKSLNGDKLSSMSKIPNTSGSFKGVTNLKKSLQKKSTSVGNIVGPSGCNITNVGELKGNVSSLPDMLDSPINSNGNTVPSTRSSSDSYSSSSSTKQLLSSQPMSNTVSANIIVDDKTALQNAVNV